MIKPYEFQKLASGKIYSRYFDYITDPALQGTLKDRRTIPFIQKLDSITGSGKTVILADTITKMSESCHPKPLIFWMSESAVVVEQTLKKLSPGGDYYHLLGDMLVDDIDNYEANLVRNDSSSIIYLCTVDTFNRKEKDGRKRKIFRDSADSGSENTWESLKKRETFDGIKRKLFIVYDEAQNLTDQQTELLWELSPDALLLATATLFFALRQIDFRVHSTGTTFKEIRRSALLNMKINWVSDPAKQKIFFRLLNNHKYEPNK